MKTYSQLTIHEKINVKGFIELFTGHKPSFDRCPLNILSEEKYLYDYDALHMLRLRV